MNKTTLPIKTSVDFGVEYDYGIARMEFDRRINLIGARRSGIHAISSWILDSFPSPRAWANSSSVSLNKPKLNLRESKTKATILLVGYEDPNRKRSLDECLERIFNSNAYGVRGETVVVVRDVYNYVASRVKSSQNYPGRDISWGYHGEVDIQIWKEQAKHALKYGNGILFNTWVNSSKYRKMIGSKLKFPLLGSPYHVADLAGGSSFDGLKFSKSPTAMQLTERYTQVSLPKEIFKKEYGDLNKELFGWYLTPQGKFKCSSSYQPAEEKAQ